MGKFFEYSISRVKLSYWEAGLLNIEDSAENFNQPSCFRNCSSLKLYLLIINIDGIYKQKPKQTCVQNIGKGTFCKQTNKDTHIHTHIHPHLLNTHKHTHAHLMSCIRTIQMCKYFRVYNIDF